MFSTAKLQLTQRCVACGRSLKGQKQLCRQTPVILCTSFESSPQVTMS